MHTRPDLRTADFDFELPAELIAQQPVEPRDAARLLHVGLSELADRQVRDLPDMLREGDLLVLNDTRVIPARIYGQRGEVGIEILLHKKEADGWLAFARPGKRLRPGDRIVFGPDFSAELIEKREEGLVLLRFSANENEWRGKLEQYGEAPLPPYIKREQGASSEDVERYQTVYAQNDGAVAAPTAGLHFTPELFAKLKAKGIDQARVTLHVGAGTFLPVKADYIRDHVMHAEYGEISADTADTINKARSEGRRIVSVGTTSLRLLEAAADETGKVQPFKNETRIFISPGYRFRAVDALLTNFHLPKSTLFMLVCAFAGMELMQGAYAHARAKSYRFYSYGDASLLERRV